MSNDKDVGYALFFFGFGIWCFFNGFKRLRRKRLVENIPTSTVRSLAMGLVELIGESKKTQILKAPLTGAECVFYRYTVERYEGSGRSGRWVVIANGDSSYCPFWLDDGTGKIMVLPQGAELIIPVNYKFESSGWGGAIPGNLVDFLVNNGLRYKGILGNYSLRFTEWYIKPDDNVYVLGTAKRTNDFLGAHKEKLIQRLEELKEAPQKMSEVDLNKDGTISEDEWDGAVAKVEQEILEEELKSFAHNDLIGTAIGSGDVGQVFIISDESQTQLTKSLSWQAFSGVFGGAVLTVTMLVYLLFRFRVF